jgi:hypothetical protein
MFNLHDGQALAGAPRRLPLADVSFLEQRKKRPLKVKKKEYGDMASERLNLIKRGK